MIAVSEWYSYHFPELIKIVPENFMFAKVVKFVKNRKELAADQLDALEELVMDSAKAKAIYEASKSSMGKSNAIYYLIFILKFIYLGKFSFSYCLANGYVYSFYNNEGHQFYLF